MYIAATKGNSKKRFIIRESYLDNGVYLSRDLLELDEHPAQYVVYLQERSFYIDPSIEEGLAGVGVRVDPDSIEEMFWHYVKPEIKRRYEFSKSRTAKGHGTLEDEGTFHIFDKRRVYFLRFGGMDQRPIHRVSPVMFQVLSGKSRDEIEQMFMVQESILKPKEFKAYVYVAFDLQRHFNKLFAREMPQALNPELVEKHFLEDICILNRDETFWRGMAMKPFLHDYLTRYVVMFFDSVFGESSFLEDLFYSQFNKRRYHRQQAKSKATVISEASRIFGVEEAELKSMTKRELKRIYRKKARELHPDRGGSHEQFVKLSNIYEELMSAHP